MARYLITHSLLASWLYAMKDNPYEDATTERDPYAEFLTTLERKPTVQTDAMKNGIDFENLVTDIISGGIIDPKTKWYIAAEKIAAMLADSRLQLKTCKEIEVSGTPLLLYGRLDALKAGTVYDIKFSKGYDRGKYIDSTQHPTYLELIPEAQRFTYVVSNGSEVWTETYTRAETKSIYPIISDFLEWLNATGLISTYKEHWVSR